MRTLTIATLVLAAAAGPALTLAAPASAAPRTYTISDASVTEGDTGNVDLVYTVSRTGDTSVAETVHPFTQYFGVSDATPTRDYVPIPRTNSMTFAPGETTKTLTVEVIGDDIDELDERVVVKFYRGRPRDGTTDTGQGTIVDDDVPGPNSTSVADAVISETGPNPRGLLVRRGDVSGRAEVRWRTVPGTATAPGDFTSTTGTASFSPGSEITFIDYAVRHDGQVEPNETFSIELSEPVDTTIDDGTGLVTVLDSDGPSRLAIDNVRVTEPTSGTTTAAFTVLRSGSVSDAFTVHPFTQTVTTTRNADYVTIPSTSSLTFAARERVKQIAVTINSDGLDEPDETFRLRFAGGGTDPDIAAVGIGTIVESDLPPGGNVISIGDSLGPEGDSAASRSLTLTRIGDLSAGAQVDFSTHQGTADADVYNDPRYEDYVTTAGTVAFAPGQASATVDVPINGDRTVEADDSFTVELSDAMGTGVSIADDTGLVTLTNDDVEPSSYRIDDAVVAEASVGNSIMSFTIVRSGNTAIATTVHPYTQDISATRNVDYVPVLSTTDVTFAPGETSKRLDIVVKSDSLDEADETFRVRFTGGSSDGQGDTAIGTIIDNFAP